MSSTIHRRALHITLLDDCVFSARNATEGGHNSLHHISGQSLLGAAAARLYGKFLSRGDDAYLAFHSGKVRFLDGLPSQKSDIAYPMPLAWHQAKSGPDKTLHNFAIGDTELPNKAQPKQMREGFLFADGRQIEPLMSMRMKTAINPDTGHAAEAQLFGYESLSKGQAFTAWIEADADAKYLLDEIVSTLQGECLLGRSRSAEYGRVKIKVDDQAKAVTHGQSQGERLTLWLLSDLALTDSAGRPSQTPTPEAFGLSGKIDWGHTFLRSRRYAPWNAFRRGYDRERLLLNAGGVITIQCDPDPSQSQLDALQSGIGLYREAGLGQLWVNPPLLSEETLSLSFYATDPPRPSVHISDPLLTWLQDQTTDWRATLDERAKVLAQNIHQVLNSARGRHGIRKGEDFGPSKSQWGRVLETARTSVGSNLYSELFTSGSAVIRGSGDGWGEIVAYRDDGSPVRLADQLADMLAVRKALDAQENAPAPDHHYAYLIRRLAHRLQSETQRQSTNQGEPAHV